MARVTTALWLAVLILRAFPAHGDPVTASTLGWTINGIVSEVARAGDVAFVGGSFSTVAPAANLVPNFAVFSTDSAVPVLPKLEVDGRIRAVVALPGGGWVIGGEFTVINGQPRQHLARLTATGALDTSFAVPVDDTVWSLAARGSTVYLGGGFNEVAGAPHFGLAAINGSTGALVTAFNPVVVGGTVNDIVATDSMVYIAGDFLEVGGDSRENLAAVLVANGSLVNAFDAGADGPVTQLILNGTDLFAAGQFLNVGGAARPGVAKLASGTGAATQAFNAATDGDVYALALSGTTLYVGGDFSQIGGQSRAHVAAINTATGAATAWNPGTDGVVLDLALAGTQLIIAGDFGEAGGLERLALAMLDTTKTTNIATTWNPSLGNGAEFVYMDAAGHVFVGGSFHNFGAVRRDNVAGIDLLTGELLGWNPGTNGWVHAMDVSGNVLYLGGDFTQIGAASRSHVAAVDVVTGVVSSWNPGPDGSVHGLVATPTVVYFVGVFTEVTGGASRGYGAAASPAGPILPWDPGADDPIESLFVDGARVIVGGSFGTLGGLPRARLGAVDAVSGAPALTFGPTVNDTVYRVDVQNGLVFFGGEFDMVNGQTRNHAAAVRSSATPAEDGTIVNWNPDVGGPVYDIDAFGANVYLVGGFGSVGGESRPGIAMVDALATGGALRSWAPGDVSGGQVSVIDTSDTAVLFGGLLNDLNGVSIGAVLYPEAALAGAPRPPTTPDILVRGSALRVDWGRPPLGARPLSYVIEGGSGPGRSDLASFSTGNANTTFAVSGLPPGTYYLRLRSANGAGAGAASGEQAFVVGAAGCSAPPSAPHDVTASVTGSTVALAWKAPVGSIGGSYRLLVGGVSGSSGLGAFDVGAVTSYSVSAPNGAYFVRVIATNACGVSVPSGEVPVIVGPVVVPPGAPFALEVAVTGSTVVLSWAPPSIGSGSFQYRVEAGSGTGLSNLANVTVAPTTFTATGVPPGTYYVRVRAIGPGGTGPAGNEVVVVVQ